MTATITAATTTAHALAAAAGDIIADQVAGLPHAEILAEYRPARERAVRSLSAWVKHDRAVVVDVHGEHDRHMAAEILDLASIDFELGQGAEIIDLPTGAMLVW